MARKPRILKLGYHHISNRASAERKVFVSDEDRLFFVSLLCNAAKKYSFYVHGYALISRGYDFIIETTKNNLPNVMKIINSQYTLYFNEKYIYRGQLWEGRYKSWYLQNPGFVFDILAYIDYLPTYVGESLDKENYFYTSYRQFIGIDERLPCLVNSLIFQHFNTIKEIKTFFAKPINYERISSIHKLAEQTRPKREKRPRKVSKSLPENFFNDQLSIAERNDRILRAYQRGYSQALIGNYLGITQQAVYKIVKKLCT